MTDDPLFMIPGPTNLPEAVREAVGQPTMYHRGPEFAALLGRCTDGLRRVFQTQNDVLILSASGTGGVEAAITNVISPDDRVLVVQGGKFGERMAKISQRYGALVTTLDLPPGRAAEPQQVADLLSRRPFKALLFVQNETSTGVTQNVATLAKIAGDYRCITVVDCVSGMAGIPVKTDEWGLDVVVAGSQKAFMLPPGLSFVSMSPRAWELAESCRTPRFYFDLLAARDSLAKGQTPYTPAVPLIQGLDASLGLIEAEGLENVFARHAAGGRATRAGIQALGLELFADPAYASNVVTAVASPEGIDSGTIVKTVLANANILISNGQSELKGKIFRIGHLGTVTKEDIVATISAVAEALCAAGHQCSAKSAVAAVHSAYGG